MTIALDLPTLRRSDAHLVTEAVQRYGRFLGVDVAVEAARDSVKRRG